SDQPEATGLQVSALQTRMALIKAYHLRRSRDNSNRKGRRYIVEMELTPDLENAAYQCGRLMAIFEEIQNRALGTVNAGVVERYYAAFSATPHLTLGRLSRLSNFHINKMGDSGGIFRNKLGGVMAHVRTLPRNFNLEEQSL